jgi:hypothetical protein
MPPRFATRHDPLPRFVSSAAIGDGTPSAADSITHVIDRMEAIEHVTEPTRRTKLGPDTEED